MISLYFISLINLKSDKKLNKEILESNIINKQNTQNLLSSRYLQYTFMANISQFLLLTNSLYYLIGYLLCNEFDNTVELDLCRLIMVLVMHIYVHEQAKTGLNMMKFAHNHSIRISTWRILSVLGFIKFVLAIYIELINSLYMLY